MAGPELGAKRSASEMQGGAEEEVARKQKTLAADPNLPAPWQAHVSARTGKPYWYNPDTKETTWVNPAAKQPEPEPEFRESDFLEGPAYANSLNSRGTTSDFSGPLPLRPGEEKCKHYLRFGKCKYGEGCRFDHPPGEAGAEVDKSLTSYDNYLNGRPANIRSQPAPILGPGGLPVRPGEQECSFFMKVGTCKYGDTCRWNHPWERQTPGAQYIPREQTDSGRGLQGGGMQGMQDMQRMMGMPGMGGNEWEMHMTDEGRPYYYNSRTQESSWETPPAMMMSMMGMGGSMGGMPSGSNGQGLKPWSTSFQAVGFAGGQHPIRPGAENCQFYMKTGGCKFGETCKYNHPEEMLGVGDGKGFQPSVLFGGGAPRESAYKKVEIRQESNIMIVADSRQTGPTSTTAEGYPVRPGMPDCSFYMKSGICKFATTCKYNHPHKGLSGLPDASGFNAAPREHRPAGSYLSGPSGYGM